MQGDRNRNKMQCGGVEGHEVLHKLNTAMQGYFSTLLIMPHDLY